MKYILSIVINIKLLHIDTKVVNTDEGLVKRVNGLVQSCRREKDIPTRLLAVLAINDHDLPPREYICIWNNIHAQSSGS